MDNEKTKKEIAKTLKAKKPVKWGNVITNIQSVILEGLARYKFLTLTQMLDLDGIGTTQYAYLWKQAASLRDRGKPLIESHSFGSPQPKKGKVEDMYYLTKYGKRALMDELFVLPEDIKMPIGKTMAYKDYHHRKRQIDFQIWLDKWARANELEIPFFDCYFDKVGNNRVAKNLRSKTAIRIGEETTLYADGAFEIINNKGEKKFYLFEMYNDKNTLRIIKQIHKHAQAMTFRSTHKKYNIDVNKSYKVVMLFNFPTIKDSVINRIKYDAEAFNYIHQYFLCASIDQLKNDDFFDSWESVFGTPAPFYKL